LNHRILMLVASDPDSDPRIEWEATYTPESWQVTAMGACALPLRGPILEDRLGYRVSRIVRRENGQTRFLFAALRLLAPLAMLPPLFMIALPTVLLCAVLAVFRRCVVLVVGCGPLYNSLRQRSRKILTILGLRIPLGFFRNVFTASTALWRGICAERPDRRTIVHCNDLDTLLVGVMAKRKFGCKLVYDCHEFMPHAWEEATSWNTWLLRRYEGWLIASADSVVTVSPLLAREIMNAYAGTAVQSVPNAAPWRGVEGMRGRGSEAARDSRNSATSPPRNLTPSQPPCPLRFLFQGEFGPGRGLEELIRAWRHIDPAEAALLLRGPEHIHKQQCMALAESLGLKDISVFFPAPVPEDRLIEAAAEADVGVIPYKPTIINFLYCCPNKLSQYMQAGLPILAGDTRYVRQLLAESGAGICYTPADEESIVAAVRRYVVDEDFREECRQNGGKFVREKFHWLAQSKPLYEAYERLAEECGSV
jgi:glycosyltransferase involved in cell wall biosynthesis